MKVSVAGFLAFSWLGVAQAQIQIQDWAPLGPPGQNVWAIAIDPTESATIYAGTSLGLYKTVDGGASWNFELGFPVDQIEVDPRTPATVYAVATDVTSFGFAFKTVDGGKAWSELPIGHLVRSLKVDVTVSSTLYAATSQGVFRSRDAGASWAAMSDGLPSLDVLQVLQAPSSPSTFYAGLRGAGTLFSSSDGGATWRAAGESLLNTYLGLGLVAVDPRSASTVYIVASGCGPRGPCITSLLRSSDGGTTFSYGGVQSFSLSGLAIDPITPSTLYMIDGPLIRRSSDGGASWSGPMKVQPGTGTTSINTVTLDPSSPSTVYAGTSTGVFRTTFVGLCTPSSTVLCLNNGRFRLEVSYALPARCSACPAGTWPITSNTGAFWFFDPTNLELVLKVLDGRQINGKWWVFYASLTDVEFTLTVTDTQTGAVKTYVNPQGQLASVADTSAF